MRVVFLFLACVAWMVSRPAAARDVPSTRVGWLQLGSHVSALSNASDRSLIGTSLGYELRGGYHFAQWGIFAQAEHNMWVATELDRRVMGGALNLGVGGEVTYLGGRVRTSVAAGPSILLSDTILDDPGEVGFFIDARPMGLRWPLGRRWGLELDPLYASIVAPVLGEIPLIMVQYRTELLVEVRF